MPTLPFGHQPCSVASSNQSIITGEMSESGLPPTPASPSSKLSLCSLYFDVKQSHLPAPTSVTSLTPPRPDGPLHPGFLHAHRHSCQGQQSSVSWGPKNQTPSSMAQGSPLAKTSTFHTQKHQPTSCSLAASSSAPSSVPSSIYDLNAGVTKTHPQALLCTELCP